MCKSVAALLWLLVTQDVLCDIGERDVKRLYILAKSEEERDHWLGQLSKITLVRDNRPSSPNTGNKLTSKREGSRRRPSSASVSKSSTLNPRASSVSSAVNPQRSASVRHHHRVENIRSSDLDLSNSELWLLKIYCLATPTFLQVPTIIHNEEGCSFSKQSNHDFNSTHITYANPLQWCVILKQFLLIFITLNGY